MAPLSFLFDSKKTAGDLEKAELVLIQHLFERQSVETRGRLPKEGTVTNPISSFSSGPLQNPSWEGIELAR